MLHGVGNCTFDAYTKVMVNVVRNFLSSTEPIFAGFSCGVTKGVKWGGNGCQLCTVCCCICCKYIFFLRVGMLSKSLHRHLLSLMIGLLHRSVLSCFWSSPPSE